MICIVLYYPSVSMYPAMDLIVKVQAPQVPSPGSVLTGALSIVVAPARFATYGSPNTCVISTPRLSIDPSSVEILTQDPSTVAFQRSRLYSRSQCRVSIL